MTTAKSAVNAETGTFTKVMLQLQYATRGVKILIWRVGESSSMERNMGREGENAHFIGDVLNGCSLSCCVIL